jgi:hypothetical protein
MAVVGAAAARQQRGLPLVEKMIDRVIEQFLMRQEAQGLHDGGRCLSGSDEVVALRCYNGRGGRNYSFLRIFPTSPRAIKHFLPSVA